MRVSESERIDAELLPSSENAIDFAAVVAHPENTVYIGLVGGNDPASMAVRNAQSFLRFDRRPSYFSQAFLFTGNGDEIVEARLVDADPRTPETQGVWRGNASRFANAEDYPNVAIVAFTFAETPGGLTPLERVDQVLQHALDPKRIRERYDLWELIGQWQPFLFEPARTPNPLADKAPHPGAVFVRWALSMAGIEVAPGSLDEYDAPEHIWAAANYWHDYYGQSEVSASVSLARTINDPLAGVRSA